jgi:hypothetical protein
MTAILSGDGDLRILSIIFHREGHDGFDTTKLFV